MSRKDSHLPSILQGFRPGLVPIFAAKAVSPKRAKSPGCATPLHKTFGAALEKLIERSIGQSEKE
ncbi:hypothetical protein [Pseudomonas brassicacearum]|uniref:hypothetical protein n=1 Tax=Pseudomonas brassicacearum TaxID=930166 RepID=UPI001181DC23|nr:hypothetical protein [Pseudomonas brassicacearum]